MAQNLAMPMRNKAVSGLLWAIVPGAVAVTTALIARRRHAIRMAEPEPTEMDYDPSPATRRSIFG